MPPNKSITKICLIPYYEIPICRNETIIHSRHKIDFIIAIVLSSIDIE